MAGRASPDLLRPTCFAATYGYEQAVIATFPPESSLQNAVLFCRVERLPTGLRQLGAFLVILDEIELLGIFKIEEGYLRPLVCNWRAICDGERKRLMTPPSTAGTR